MNKTPLKALFDTLETAFDSLGIDYYLIGALAREVWYRQGDVPFRTTKDVDFAVLVGSQGEFEALKMHLIDHGGFRTTEANAFILIAPNGIQVDILPFGELEQNGMVSVQGEGLTNIHISGLSDVFRFGTQLVELETGNRFKVATLPGIVLLKLIAFDDRPEVRQKDARDIANIIIHFFNLNTQLIYGQHVDLFGEEEISLENISCIVIGREIRNISIANASLHQRTVDILSRHISDFEQSSFLLHMVSECKKSISETRAFLRSILAGMEQ